MWDCIAVSKPLSVLNCGLCNKDTLCRVLQDRMIPFHHDGRQYGWRSPLLPALRGVDLPSQASLATSVHTYVSRIVNMINITMLY